MSRIPIRLRLTLVVGLTALIALGLLAGLSSNTINETLVDRTIDSTGQAMADRQAVARNIADDGARALRGLTQEIDGWPREGEPFPVDDWETRFGPETQLFDRDGERTTPEALARRSDVGEVVLAGRVICTRWSPFDTDCGADAELRSDVLLLEAIVEEQVSGTGVVVADLVEWGDARVVLITEVRLENDAISTGLTGFLLLFVPILALGLAGITWLALGRALRPVEAMTTEVERIELGSLEHRVPVPRADDQLGRLAATLNGMLNRLERARDQQRRFVSDASHELRSPITATMATLQVARSQKDETDWEHVATVLEEENNRLAELVDDLLLLARLDEGEATGPHAVDLDEICLAEARRPHPVPVDVRIITPARVTGDPSMLARAIRNLVDNATVHASEWVEVTVDLSKPEVGGDGSLREAVVRVSDDGPGIPAEHQSTIFERFSRTDESRTRDGRGGAGLGLAIVAEVAAAHGGSVDVGSSERGGACFSLTVPVAV